MDLLTLILITAIATLHVSVQNRVEKVIVQVVYGSRQWTKRPDTKCNNINPLLVSCYGMPSGHTEFAVVLFLFLGLIKFLPIPIALMLILAVGMQRIIFRYHTLWQVMTGLVLGLIYVSIYHTAWNIHPWLMLAACVSIVMLSMIVSVLLLTIVQHKTNFPDWVHPSLYPIIYNKQVNTSFLSKLLYYGGHVLINSDYGFLTWRDLETLLDDKVTNMQKPDVVIGIKTGGAILAGRISQKLGIPMDFIRTKRAIYNCTSSVQNSVDVLKDVINVESNHKEDYQVCEKPRIDLGGKHVLLVDETAYSGGTIQSAKRYLLMKGAATVRTFVVSGIKNVADYDYLAAKVVMAWTWSFDN